MISQVVFAKFLGNMDTILHKTKSLFAFNYLYVIESLDENDGDKLTGTSLLERLKPYADNRLSTALITVETVGQWREAMDYLKVKAKNGQRPMIHFEIHGTDEKDGLYIKNGDVVEWPEVLQRISEINYACGCNLLVSFAVCYGEFLAQYINAYHRMPFCLSLGSFEVLYEDDLEERFFAFYKELITNLDVDKAFQALIDAKKDMPSKYTLIKADVLFAQVLKSYLENKCTRKALILRAEESIVDYPEKFKNMSPKEIRQFKKDFVKCERENHETFYKESYENYFQLNEHPENKERFLIFTSSEDLLNAFKKKEI